MRNNDIDLQPHELRSNLGQALITSLAPAILDREIATLDPPEFAQPLHKSSGPLAHARGRIRAQESDGRHRGLLRTRRKRPSCRAAKKYDELASPHVLSRQPENTPYHILN